MATVVGQQGRKTGRNFGPMRDADGLVDAGWMGDGGMGC